MTASPDDTESADRGEGEDDSEAEISGGMAALSDNLRDAGRGEEVTLGEIVDKFGARGYGPLLLVPSLLALSPVGAIPGMSVITGSLIFVVAIQMLVGRSHPWLPNKLLSISTSRDKVEATADKLRPWAERLDKLLRNRWAWAVDPPARQLTAAVCLLLAASMYPLALLPLAVAAPAACLTLVSLGVTFHDGLWIVLGWTGVTAVGYLLFVVLT